MKLAGRILTTVILVLLAIQALPCFAIEVVDTAWVRRYNGPTNGSDAAYAISVDDFGNVYVTGASDGGISRDFATIKYYPNGDTAWVRRYDGPGSGDDNPTGGIAVDDSGYVCVAGESWGGVTGFEFATVKYDTDGDTVWVRRYDGPNDGHYRPGEIAVDDSGNVAVTGYSDKIDTLHDFTTIMYDCDGDTIWVRSYDGSPHGKDVALDVAVDDSGNVYVTGYSDGIGTDLDFATIKYSPDGDTAWLRRYDGPVHAEDRAQGIAVDDSGNVYVTGYSDGDGTSDDFATIKYYPNGDTSWVGRYDGPVHGEDIALDIAVDDSGNAYVTGYSDGGTMNDIVTIKYYPEGDTAWVRRYDGPGSGHDEASDIAVDDSGNVYVAGHSEDGGGYFDFITVKYHPDGDTAWVRRYDGPNNDDDHATDIAVDASGNAYVTGFSYGIGTDFDFATIKYIQYDSIPFAPAVNYGPSDGSHAVFCADLDGDLDLDLAVANEQSDNISVFKNVGDGTFESAVNYISGTYPVDVFCADLDQDGDLDLAVANVLSDSVSIFMNYGDGTFQDKLDYGTEDHPLFVFCADLDGDSDFDLAVANQYSNSVSILKNNGNGIFQSNGSYLVGDRPHEVFGADLDGDNDLDLAVANLGAEPGYIGSVPILENNGDGTFQDAVSYAAGSGTYSVFCVDLDGDLDLDIAVANYYSDNVSILKNNGDGTFQSAVSYITGTGPVSVSCADLDGDSDQDLAVAAFNSDRISVLRNNGDGTFEAKVDYEVGTNPYSVFCADLDGDLDLDLAVSDFNSDSVSILKNLTQVPANQPPWAFSLITPADEDTTFGSTTFQWQIPYDPNFGDQMRYDLYVGTSPGFEPEYTDIDSNLPVSKHTKVMVEGTYFWKVKAQDNWGAETWSTETWSFAVRPLFDTLWIVAYSPVDLIVTDPVGDSISLDTNTIQDADYDTTVDWNEDEDNDDLVTIPHPYVGEYQIRVIREDDIAPDDTTYDLGIRINGSALDLLADDESLPPPDGCSDYSYDCLPCLRGDVNCDGVINSADIVSLINYLFKSGPAPDPLELGYVNCGDDVINSADVVYLIDYLFKGGPPPCS